MKKQTITLNVQHDYITMRTPNGNFTVSFNGYKASGGLATNKIAFKNLTDFIEKSKTSNNGDAMKELATEVVLNKLWPEWNAEPSILFKENDIVIVEGKFSNLGEGRVIKVKSQNASVNFSGKVISVPLSILKIKK